MAVLLHPLSDGVRPPRVIFSTEYQQRTLAQDREIIERIIAAYHHALGSTSAKMKRSMYGTVWGRDGFDRGQRAAHALMRFIRRRFHRGDGHQGGLIRALEERSLERTHEILRQFHLSDAAHGIAMGKAEAEAMRTNPAQAHHYGLMWVDRLVGLAEASGALPLTNPEDNFDAWQKALEVDIEQVAAAIERSMGMPLEFPDVTGVFGCELRGRPLPLIVFTHLLLALSIRPWVQAVEDPRRHVVEIGGGFGSLAYWTTRLVPCGYTIYDLPFASAAQAYFLWRARPGQPLRLSGEGQSQAGEIALLPGWALLQDPPRSADVVVNQDALVEIPRRVATAYLSAVRGFLNGPFLSVNHESWQRLADTLDRTSVAELVAAAGGFVRLSRGPFALRQGYVQEIYGLSGATLRAEADRPAIKRWLR